MNGLHVRKIPHVPSKNVCLYIANSGLIAQQDTNVLVEIAYLETHISDNKGHIVINGPNAQAKTNA